MNALLTFNAEKHVKHARTRQTIENVLSPFFVYYKSRIFENQQMAGNGGIVHFIFLLKYANA